MNTALERAQARRKACNLKKKLLIGTLTGFFGAYFTLLLMAWTYNEIMK